MTSSSLSNHRMANEVRPGGRGKTAGHVGVPPAEGGNANLNAQQARRFLELLLQTKDDELDCAGLMELIDRYVEIGARGEDPASFAPEVPPHLRQCPDCAELVASLLHLVELEESGQMPEIDAMWAELRAVTSTSGTKTEPTD